MNLVILKVKKATDVSIRKCLRIQKQKSEQRKKLQELEDKRGKRLAAKFIISQSSVTYQPPVGYYRPFGVQDKMVEADSPKEDSDIIEIDDDDDACIVDDVSNRTKPLKKPKVGFLKNKVITEDDEENKAEEEKRDENPLKDDDAGVVDDTLNAEEEKSDEN